ncbi:MAG: flagellar brake protein [Cellvibrio sp.]
MHFISQWFKSATSSNADSAKALAEGKARSNNVATIPSRLMPLWSLYQQRQLIELRWNNSQLSYQTAILALDVERNLLWLDDVTPYQHQLDLQDIVRLRCVKQDQEMVIEGEILALGRDYGATGFAIALPEQPIYTPRRKHPRISCGDKPNSFANLRALGGDTFLGVIQDVSIGGMKVSLYGNHTQNFRPNNPLAHFEFQLAGQKPIKEDARVTSVRFVKNDSRITQVGIEFADKSPEAFEKRHELLRSWLNSYTGLRSA